MQSPKQHVSHHVSARTALLDYGGGVAIISLLCAASAYVVTLVFVALTGRDADPLQIAAHAGYIAAFSAAVGALTLLGLNGW